MSILTVAHFLKNMYLGILSFLLLFAIFIGSFAFVPRSLCSCFVCVSKIVVNSFLSGTIAFLLNPFLAIVNFLPPAIQSNANPWHWDESALCCLWYLGHFSKSLVICPTLLHSSFLICSGVRRHIADQVRFAQGFLGHSSHYTHVGFSFKQ